MPTEYSTLPDEGDRNFRHILRATTYGTDERWAGKILENVEKMRDDEAAAVAGAVTKGRREKKR